MKNIKEITDIFKQEIKKKYTSQITMPIYMGVSDMEIILEEIERLKNIIKELNDKIEDDKMIIEGNWGCIDNLKKDYIMQKNIIEEIREYNKKIIEEGWYGGFEKDNAKHNLEILNKGADNEEN